MESKGLGRSTAAAAILLACVGVAMAATPARAQLVGEFQYTRGYDLYPIPHVAGYPMTLVLYGIYPIGCGTVESRSESGSVELTLRSFAACPDSAIGTWAESFSLGAFAAGTHTVSVTIAMDRPDSGLVVHEGTLTFDVLGSPPPPPDSRPSPPDSIPPAPTPVPPWPVPPSLVIGVTTNPSVPRPDVPIELTV